MIHFTTRFLLANLIVLVIQISNISLASAQISLHGIVLDSVTNNAIENAQILLIHVNKDKTVSAKSYITEKNGYFEFHNLEVGEYTLTVGAIHIVPKKMKLDLSASNKSLDLGYLKVTSKENSLAELKITSKRLLSQEENKIIYHVGNDPEKQTANIQQILGKVPLLSLDFSGKIKYLGLDNYLVQLDGKIIPANSIVSILRSTPASTIKSVEVITSPPAKYQTEGILAIINIVTDKNIFQKVLGSVNAEIRYPIRSHSGSGSLTFKEKNFLSQSFLSLGNMNMPSTDYTLIRENPLEGNLEQMGKNESKNTSTNFSQFLSYEIDSVNLINFRLGLAGMNNTNFSEAITTFLAAEAVEFQNQLKAKVKELELGVDYQRNFKGDKVLNLSYLLLGSNQNEFGNVHLTRGKTDSTIIQTNKTKQEEHTGQIDYTQSLGKTKIEIGSKFIARLGSAQFGNSDIPTNIFDYNQYIFSLYNSYNYTIKNVQISSALRFESTTNTLNYREINSTKRQFYHLLPTLNLNMKLENNSRIILMYTHSVQRPHVSYMNPFVNELNPILEVSGNPNLHPSLNKNLTLQWRRVNVASNVFSLLFSQKRNAIQELITDNFQKTAINVGKVYSLSGRYNHTKTYFKKLGLNLSAALTHISHFGQVQDQNLKRTGLIGDINSNISFRIDQRTHLSTNFNFTSSSYFLQGRSNNVPSWVITGSRSMLDGKLSVSASIVNPFRKFQYNKIEYIDADFYQLSSYQAYSRVFRVIAAYRFGEIRGSHKSNRKSINNNDSLKK